MISIHSKCRLELYAYITYIKNKNKNKHVIHAVANVLCSQPTVPVQWLGWKKYWHFPLWKQPRLAYFTKRSRLHDEHLSHWNEWWQNKQTKGKYRPCEQQTQCETPSFSSAKYILLTVIAHHSPCGRMPYESEVTGHSRFALNQAQNTRRHVTDVSSTSHHRCIYI